SPAASATGPRRGRGAVPGAVRHGRSWADRSVSRSHRPRTRATGSLRGGGRPDDNRTVAGRRRDEHRARPVGDRPGIAGRLFGRCSSTPNPRNDILNYRSGGPVGSVIKKRRKRMAKKKHRKLLKRTRVQRRNKK